MKYLYFIPFTTILLASCAGKDYSNTAINEELPIQNDSLAHYRDTLIGKFDGIHTDTLIAEPFGPKDTYDPADEIHSGHYFNWRVFSKQGTVEELRLENSTIGIQFVKEGDLDGDGKDEWGYVTEWPTSNWMRYKLYHNHNGKWELLIEPTAIWLPHLDPGNETHDSTTVEDLVQPSETPGVLKVKFSDLRNDGEDFLLIDTLINVNQADITM